MKFKNWIVNEVLWISFPQTERIEGKPVGSIDFRFEDWKKSLEQKGITPPNVGGFIWDGFSAKLPSGGFLNNFPSVKNPETGRSTVPPPTITPKAANKIVLPDYWYDMAIFYDNGKVVKTPFLGRDTD